MKNVELTPSLCRHFQELKPLPFAGFQKHGAMFALIPRTELFTPGLRRPHTHRKNPGSRFRTGTPAGEHRAQALLDDIRRRLPLFAKDEAALVVLAQEAFGCAPCV